MKSSLLLALGVLAPAFSVAPALAAPAAIEKPAETGADEIALATRLFERATKSYGEATNVKFAFSTVVKLDEDSISSRGSLIFEAPARFRLEQTQMRDKTVFVYDGHSLLMQQNDEMPQRVVVRPNFTVWDELPDASLPDPWIASFLAGENPLDEFISAETQIQKLPDQTIGGALAEGISVVNSAGEASLSISAWFSRESGVLLRVITIAGGARVTSNYSQIQLDSDIPAGTFALSLADKDTA